MADSFEAMGEMGFWQTLEALEDQHWTASSFAGEGNFSFKGQLRFGGSWKGSIASTAEDKESHLFLLASAHVEGSIKVPMLTVGGCLDNIEINADHVILLDGSRVTGIINAKHLSIDDGAIFQGQSVVVK